MAAAPSVDDARSLGRCLNLCTSLQSLGMSVVGLSDEACVVLFSILARGAMAKLYPVHERKSWEHCHCGG
eukprot:2653593-Prymnesium_polylepis.1